MASVGTSVDLLLGGEIVRVDSDNEGVRSGSISISTGSSDWSTETDPGEASFTLDNRSGNWSPDNPDGAYFGDLRRFVETRISRDGTGVRLESYGTDPDICTTPLHSSLEITGDLEIRVSLEMRRTPVPDNSGPDRTTYLVSHADGDDDSGWALYLYRTSDNGGWSVQFGWYDTGGSFNVTELEDGTDDARIPWEAMGSRVGIRVTVDVDNGAGGAEVSYSYSDDGTIDGSWVDLDTVTLGSTIDMEAPSSTLTLGSGGETGSQLVNEAYYHEFRLYDGIGGTVVLNPDFTAQSDGTTSFADSAGRTWTVGDGGRLTNQYYRFHGELDSLPTRWSQRTNNVVAPLTARGVFYRLVQDKRVRSGLTRFLETDDTYDLVGYWPCEEEGDYLSQFSPLVGSSPMVVSRVPPNAADNDDFVSSLPIPTLGPDSWSAVVDSYADSTGWALMWLMSVPEDFSGTADTVVVRVETDVYDYEVQYRDGSGGGDLRVVILDGETVEYSHAYTDFDIQGKPLAMFLEANTDGGDIDISLTGMKESQLVPSGIAQASAVSTAEAGNVSLVEVNTDSGCEGWAIGQLALFSEEIAPSFLAETLNSYRGETAANRVARLCLENDLDYRLLGDPDSSEPMGPQLPKSTLGLLRECARTDIGLLYELPDWLGVGYRTRASMLAQGDRLENPRGLMGWWSAGDLLTTGQTLLPNRFPELSGDGAATLSEDTGEVGIVDIEHLFAGSGPPAVTSPDQGSGFTQIGFGIGQGSTNEPSPTITAPPSPTQEFDYAGTATVNPVRLWSFTDPDTSTITLGFGGATDGRSFSVVVALDKDPTSIEVTGTPTVAGGSATASFPTLTGIAAGWTVLAIAVNQSSRNLTAAPSGYTTALDTTGSAQRACVFTSIATGSSETPGDVTYDSTSGAIVTFVVGLEP